MKFTQLLRHSLVLTSCTLIALAGTTVAHAAKITSFSPEGEIAQIRQVTAKFDESMVPMGDPNADAPIELSCTPDEVLQGQGRWVDDKIWVYDFSHDLPPGTTCTAKVSENLTSIAGNAYSGQMHYQFNTGGPFPQAIRPWEGNYIAEDQAFILRLTGDATAQSIKDYVWCESSSIGEKIPVQIIEGDDRHAIMDRYGWGNAAKENPLQYWILQCQQRLNPGDNVKLIYGAGVQTPTGIANSEEKPYRFTVREPFLAEFSCTRENAHASCMPLAAMVLDFNAYLPIDLAEQITLTAQTGEIYRPVISDNDRNQGGIQRLTFAAPLPEKTSFTLSLPQDIKDDSGRPLENADKFPLEVATDLMPVLAKFASAPFGIIELYATPDEPPMVPLTVRNIENTLDLKGRTLPANRGTVSQVTFTDDIEIIRWLRIVEQFNYGWINTNTARQLAPRAILSQNGNNGRDYIQTRTISLLGRDRQASTIELPPREDGTGSSRPTEVIGIPVSRPGYHVLELASPALGQALLRLPDEEADEARTMYVRTGVLVTDLSVHAKIGRENALVWVTRLSDGQPVANAQVSVRNCNGTEYFSGTTDERGIVEIDQYLSSTSCNDFGSWDQFLFISARAEDKNAEGGIDMAFTLSTWDKGIEAWRFGYPTNYSPIPSSVATTVFDRTLLRAGETVSMKHFIRDLTMGGFSIPELSYSIDTVKIVHQGSGQEVSIPITWNQDNDGFSASSSFTIPVTAKLGQYRVFLIDSSSESHNRSYYYPNERDVFEAGSFQVEEFRLPVFEGNISITGNAAALVRPAEIPLSLQINFLSGGGASELPVQISAVVRPLAVNFPRYNRNFSFAPPEKLSGNANSWCDINWDESCWDMENENENTSSSSTTQKLIADKLPLTLDQNGSGSITLNTIPAITEPQDLLVEASFADPNGEIVTLRRSANLWPAGVIAGIRNDEWVSIVNSKISLQAIALDTLGNPKAGVPLEIRARERITISTRNRLVGGFYAYNSHVETKDLGVICSGVSDEQGLLTCEHQFTIGGNIDLIAIAQDENNNKSIAATSLWVASRDELWFGGSDSDRIDLIPENPSYQVGDIARFQLRMPFRQATALVTVEREGILESHIMNLTGNKPVIELKVGENWGPNVYISALVLRGRIHDVPLYSLFEWGYKDDDQWWQDYQNNLDYVPPTAMVDLSKPAYRMGVASIKIDDPAYMLDVKVTTDQPVYQIRQTAQATITVLLPDGTPAANADVALAVVDEALLELKNNTSWNLLSSMLRTRSWGVYTSTAQMEVVGRRHYGLKAVAAGGGGAGAGSNARELFDTLLLWKPYVQLDENGQAIIDIPINDSLTAFRVVAVAAQGQSRFGTGVSRFQSTQDLQLISGLPPVIRTDDDYRAAITVRNATDKPMSVEITAQATGVQLSALTLDIPPNAAREAVWTVLVPNGLAGSFEGTMNWEIHARDLTNGATDSIKVSQRVLTSVPITVRQATLRQLDGTLELSVRQPADSLEGRGGIQVSMVPRLADGLPAIEEWFNRYPYVCLEQLTSKALGTRNVSQWQSLANRIPTTYLDEDGLTYYYPPPSWIHHQGSPTLTAYILASAHEASKLDPDLKLPDSVSAPMLAGLTLFAEGKIRRNYWSPRKDSDMQLINAMEALSRYGHFKPRMLGNISITPNHWPTTTVIQWMQILQRTPEIENRDERLEQAQQILRSRLNVAGTRMGFSTEADDYWWWMMWNADLNAAYLLLATLDEPSWQEDLPRLVTGFIARQQTGTWHTTTSNLWGSFALEQFSRKFESEPVAGLTQVQMIDEAKATIANGTIDWAQVERSDRHNDIGTNAPSYNAALGAPSAAASFVNNSVFLQWPTPMQQSTVILNQDGTGRPWATIQSLAAVPLRAQFAAGYFITKTITPINEQVPGQVTRGDIWRVRIEVEAQTDMTWVVINDPIPGGATILGSGLGRDSEIAVNTPTAQDNTASCGWRCPWLAYQERAHDGFRAYYQFVPKGTFSIEYTVRLNNEGTFILPPTRTEALYAPEMFGEIPNATVTIKPMP